MRVKKSSGVIVPFSSRKLYRSVRGVGGSSKLARLAIKQIRSLRREIVSSREIFKIVLSVLRNQPGVAERYRLKEAIFNLGPTGFPFEKFFARVLEYYHYETKVDVKIPGKRVIQEVDIDARSPEGERFMIECKYHNEPGIITKLHPALYTYARFLDVKKNGFDIPWLVTNTKCSLDAINYAKGVGLKITSWNYPKGESLVDLIVKKRLYPISVLEKLNFRVRGNLFEKGIITLQDLLSLSFEEFVSLGVGERLARELYNEAKEVCGGCLK